LTSILLMISRTTPTKVIIPNAKAETSITMSQSGVVVKNTILFGIRNPMICPISRTTMPEWKSRLPQNNLFDSRNCEEWLDTE